MRRILGVLAMLALVSAVVPPATADAACAYGHVRFHPFSGNDIIEYCVGVNDADMESDPGLVLGPLNYPGGYHDDFSVSQYESGLRWLIVEDYPGGANWKVCIYYAKNYVSPIRPTSYVDPGYYHEYSIPGSMGSFLATTGSTC